MVDGIVSEKRKRRTVTFYKNAEELFLLDAINDLKHGNTTYIYNEKHLEKLKAIFKDLDIKRNGFYWAVRNKEVNERF